MRRLAFIPTLSILFVIRSYAFVATTPFVSALPSFKSLCLSQQQVADVETAHFDLSTGVSMLIESSKPKKWTNKPPILFLHGSFHGSWCWSERFFPFFVERGFPVVALNWRGTGGTKAGDGVTKVKITEHVADLNSFLEDVLPQLGYADVKPTVVCHSFGGLAVMKYLEQNPASKFSGIVMMCSVPPSGNGKMTMRYLKRSLIDSWKITAGFAMKRVLTNDVLCRELFFGGMIKAREDGSVEDYGIPDADVHRYQAYFARDSAATIDLLDLAKQLPSSATTSDGRASFVAQLPPCLVMGATDDMVVDREGIDETAKYFGLDDYKMIDSPHDVMLGAKWQNAATALHQWIEDKVLL
ncbi:hypothetical protein FisN_4Hh395 [Fistulifera solaris]|jgi:pimeloyl-ACP methyl ester carboxylesterase|uniref:AB hydrolase-1 domain-containing protein n=1 Tax=Fistulifera solaris TaxID=1519565 RepID=A0A1Z5KQ15_FISSO|nr:hypothetical protein FisN_4Hh395 [Fistulifera solaris]|eukprot:GAX28414.1 hypothetical protein FisN_4Hh395 [Fistulifera solaris]